MAEQDLAELRSRLASTRELVAEVRHQRDALERQLLEAEMAQRELRRLLLGREQRLAGGSAAEAGDRMPASRQPVPGVVPVAAPVTNGREAG